MSGTTVGPVERASAEDVLQLATDVGRAPMQVGVVLVLGPAESGALDPAEARRTLGTRLATVPRLRQRLERAPFGCGRPVWVDDPGFDWARHVDTVALPDPGDEEALLAVAAECATRRLPLDRPPWSAHVVTGLRRDGPDGPPGMALVPVTALVVVFHHVLADGIGGLAVLANLVDGAPEPPASVPPPRPAPRPRALAIEAWSSRLRAVGNLPVAIRRLRGAVAELRSTRPGRARRCSLNRPTGPRRRFAVVRADVEAVHAAARSRQGTVNDVVLTAVAGALHELLAHRGEDVPRFVASVPVSARRQATVAQLGNQVGVMPVEVPGAGPPAERLAAVAELMRNRRDAPRGASTALMGPVFRVLARLGVFGWYIDRQHLVHTFVTNVRGPAERLAFGGVPIVDAMALSAAAGNVAVAFAVLSYAGTLAITIVADPDAGGDLDVLAGALRRQLDELTRVRPPGQT